MIKSYPGLAQLLIQWIIVHPDRSHLSVIRLKICNDFVGPFALTVSIGNRNIILIRLDLSSVKMTNRLEEAIKQIRIVKEKVDDPEVSQESEQALEALQNAVESLEDDD